MWQKLRTIVKDFIRSHTATYEQEMILRYICSANIRKKMRKVRAEIPFLHAYLPKKRPGKKLCVVFLCQMPQVWTSLKSVYLAARNDKDIDAYILTLPEKVMRKNYNFHHEEYEPENKSYEMCKELEYGEKVIDAYNYSSGKWFDLRTIEPDYIFISRPYDAGRPLCYKTDELKKYTKICFIDYGYGINDRALFMTGTFDFTLNCSFAFASSKYRVNDLQKVLDYFHASNPKIKFFGYPRFDLFDKNTYGGGGQ